MTLASGHAAPVFVSGEVRFTSALELPSQMLEAERHGLLPVELGAPGPADRGRLSLHIEAAVEGALLRRGACAPGVGAAASLEASLNDQLYRARLLELRGMALSLPPLYGIADLSGALDPDDSATLRFFCEAARRVPLRVLIDEDNRNLCVYTRPEPLRKLIEQAASAAELSDDEAQPPSESPAVSPEVAASRAAMDLSEPPPAVVERDGALAFTQPPELDNEEPAAESEPLAARASQRESATPLHIGDLAEALVKSLTEPDGSPPAGRAEKLADEGFPTTSDGERANARVEVEREPANPQGHSNAPSNASADANANANASADASEKPTISVPPLYPNAADEWRGWLRDLVAARGPKPLSAIERMFVTSYVPLRTAELMGHGDADARRALETWSTSFAQSYHDAFDALRVRGKRPSMVLDVPEIALRIGRLHGARSVQLVLVDGMRFDLGLRVEQRVRALVGQQAALTERLLLWSALPATTEVQLDLIGRGAEGLRDPSPPAETEVPVARGRAAATLRRVKTGYRDLLKLDLVEAKLAETGADEATRLDLLADEASHVLAEHLVKQAPRTLVVAFGDHGFLLERLESGGTARAKSGGATPEEVLVPAFAWLVGGVH
jgi:hypothetical protein